MLTEFIPTVGHQHFEKADGPRHLMFGPIVPEGEIWTLRLMAAKNNGKIPSVYGHIVAAEASVCIFTPPRPSDHEDSPPGTWVPLEGKISLWQYGAVKWEGALELRGGTQLGAWFRGAEEGDSLELNAIYDVEVFGEDILEDPDLDTTISIQQRSNSAWHGW